MDVLLAAVAADNANAPIVAESTPLPIPTAAPPIQLNPFFTRIRTQPTPAERVLANYTTDLQSLNKVQLDEKFMEARDMGMKDLRRDNTNQASKIKVMTAYYVAVCEKEKISLLNAEVFKFASAKNVRQRASVGHAEVENKRKQASSTSTSSSSSSSNSTGQLPFVAETVGQREKRLKTVSFFCVRCIVVQYIFVCLYCFTNTTFILFNFIFDFHRLFIVV